VLVNRHCLFWKIVGLSLLLGLEAGVILGLATGLVFAAMGGYWAIVIGLGYGSVLGLALGLVNGLLLACIICLLFFPLTDQRRLRWVTQPQSVIVSVLVTALLTLDIANTYVSFMGRLVYIIFPLVAAAAWWASCIVDDWYEEHGETKSGPSAA